MNSQKTVIELIKKLSGQSNVLTIPRIFIHITGDIKSALFLSQCVYWSDKTKREDGFFYKDAAEWEEETGLTRREQMSIREKVKTFVDIKLVRANGAPTLHYRVDFDKLADAILTFCENHELSKSQNVENHFDEMSNSDFDEKSKTLTDTTQENTQIDLTKTFLQVWKELFPEKSQPKPTTINEKLKTRMRCRDFAEGWRCALETGARTRVLHNAKWFNVTFFLRNDENFQKVLDGWMDWKDEETEKSNGNIKTGVQRPAATQEGDRSLRI